MVLGKRQSTLDINGLAGGRTEPQGVVGTVSVLAGLLFAILISLTHYGGGLWQAFVMLVLVIGAGLSAWLLTYRQFINLVTVLLAFTFPMALNLQFYDFPPSRIQSGMPPGFRIWDKDIFLLILWVNWFVNVCLRRNLPSWKVGPAAKWLGVMFLAALMFPVHTAYLPGSVMHYIALLRYGFAFLYLAKKVDSVSVLRWIVIGICAQIWIESLVSWAQYLAGHPLGLEFLGETRIREEEIPGGALIRTGALLGHPNRLAEWLVLVGPLPLAMALIRDQTARARVFYWATFLVLNITLILTFSRAGWVCSVFNILATYHILKRRQGKPMVVSLWTPIITGVVVAVVLILGVYEIRSRLTADDRGSTFARVPQFITAANMIAHNPVSGVGLGSYSYNIHRYANFDGRYASALHFRVHNGWLLWTAETGLLGGLAYLMFWFYNLKRGWGLWRLKDDFLAVIGTATFIGLISWWVKSMYNIHSPLTDYTMFLHAAMLYVVYNCARRQEREARSAPQ